MFLKSASDFDYLGNLMSRRAYPLSKDSSSKKALKRDVSRKWISMMSSSSMETYNLLVKFIFNTRWKLVNSETTQLVRFGL